MFIVKGEYFSLEHDVIFFFFNFYFLMYYYCFFSFFLQKMGNIQSTPQPDVTFPQNASEWTISNLSALKIFYDDRATDLSVYMSLLIKESDEIALSDIQLPAIYSFMSTRTLLAHPFVFDERTFGTEEQKTSNRNNGKTDVREALRVLNAEGTQNFQDSLPQDIRYKNKI